VALVSTNMTGQVFESGILGGGWPASCMDPVLRPQPGNNTCGACDVASPGLSQLSILHGDSGHANGRTSTFRLQAFDPSAASHHRRSLMKRRL
jgi:hypothetical protein